MISGTDASSEEKLQGSSKKQVKTKEFDPKRLGYLAAYSGGHCKTEKELTECYGFNSEKIKLYLESYEETAKKHKSELDIRKARMAGRKQGARANVRPTEEKLVSSGYSSSQAKAYLKGFDKAFKNKCEQKSPVKEKVNHTSLVAEEEATQQVEIQQVEIQLPESRSANSNLENDLQEAKNAGKYLASFGRARPVFEALKVQNEYTDKEAQAFLDAFDEYNIDKAAKDGRLMALSGITKPGIDELKQQKGYSDDVAKACLAAFEAVEAEKTKQSIQQAQRLGRNASLANKVRPTVHDLKVNNNYSDEHAMAYLEGFDAQENAKKMTSAKMAGIEAAQSLAAKPTLEQLKQFKSYSDEEASNFFNGFDEALAVIVQREMGKLRASGRNQARQCLERPTIEKLTRIDKYSVDQALAYLAGYDSIPTDDPIRKLNEAKKAGKSDALIGVEKPTTDALKSTKAYNDFEVLKYLEGFVDGEIKKTKIALKNAIVAGKAAAKTRLEKPTKEWLKNNKAYTDEQITAYLQAFDAAQVDLSAVNAKKNAKKAGSQAARRGAVKPTPDELMQDGHSEEEAKAYLEGFDSVKVTETSVKQNRAKHAGYFAAYAGLARPTIEELKHRKAYSEQEITAYFKGFDLVGIDQVKLNKAKKAARKAVSTGSPKPTAEMLKQSGFTIEEVNAYFETFDSLPPVTEAAILINKARNSGKRAASKGKTRPTIDELKEKKRYSNEQIEAYLKGYDAPGKKRRKQPEEPVEAVVATPTALSVLAAVAPSPQIQEHGIPTDAIMALDERSKTLLPAFALKKHCADSCKSAPEEKRGKVFSLR